MGKLLPHSRLFRAGRTAKQWSVLSTELSMTARSRGLELAFGMPSKGGGITDVKIELDADDFYSLILEMVAAERQAALVAMTAILAQEIAAQPGRDDMLRRKGREDIRDAADRAWFSAPYNENGSQKLVRDSVRQFINEMKAAESES